MLSSEHIPYSSCCVMSTSLYGVARDCVCPSAIQVFALMTSPTDQLLVSWPIAALRRYGVNNVSLTIVTGRYMLQCSITMVTSRKSSSKWSLLSYRNCSTGEGMFQFFTQHSRRVYSRLHAMAVREAAAKTHTLRRTGSEVS